MSHPYRGLPDHAFWRKAVADIECADVDPVVCAPFQIEETTKIATAGSCFAQHIARHLRTHGLNFLVTEPAHDIATPEIAQMFNFGLFTARYGNIYTSKQLLQLIERAYAADCAQATTSARGRPDWWRIDAEVWRSPDGSFIDGFRPTVQPGGFISEEELIADRIQHLAAVRRAFNELDVFIFTLGLTEYWGSKKSGAAYPMCPGVVGGTFDPEEHFFGNLNVQDVVDDMTRFTAILRERNPGARIILTVSPVPLVATAATNHVLVSTTYSKSVLRVAADTVANTLDGVAYFPSYEIITGPHTRGRYFSDDLRSVTEAGVAHVMRLFLKHYAKVSDDALQPEPQKEREVSSRFLMNMERVVEVNCDEVALADAIEASELGATG